jgi:hypothetical protein
VIESKAFTGPAGASGAGAVAARVYVVGGAPDGDGYVILAVRPALETVRLRLQPVLESAVLVGAGQEEVLLHACRAGTTATARTLQGYCICSNCTYCMHCTHPRRGWQCCSAARSRRCMGTGRGGGVSRWKTLDC